MKFHFQVIMKDGHPAMSFGTDFGRARYMDWLSKNVGKFGTIEPREKISKEARGYFEGALCPAYLKWAKKNPHDRDNLETIREIFKIEFNGKVVNFRGKPMQIAKSTSRLSRQEFRDNFIAKIVEYFVENGIPVPNPELYKTWNNKWRDKYPLYSFWEFLEHFHIRCDTGVEEATEFVPEDVRKVEYPVSDNNKPAF